MTRLTPPYSDDTPLADRDDGVDRIGDDLRVEAENVLADVLSGVRHD